MPSVSIADVKQRCNTIHTKLADFAITRTPTLLSREQAFVQNRRPDVIKRSPYHSGLEHCSGSRSGAVSARTNRLATLKRAEAARSLRTALSISLGI